MEKQLSVCIISVYFGEFLNSVKLWIKSCEYNPTIDFLLVTDQKITYPLPPNIHLFPYTLQKMQQKATEILGFNANLNRPYKCCDYKTIYGCLFSEQLKKYDYWGYCDMDILFGDIRSFLNKYNLQKYDKFLTLGHLSLYRNVKKINDAYMLSGAIYNNKPISYKDVFSNDINYTFDELRGIYSIFIKNKFTVFYKNIFADISFKFIRYRIVDDFYQIDPIKPCNYRYQIFYWEKGKVKRAYYKQGEIHTEEYIYIHFQKRPNFLVNFDENKIDSFYITHCGFFPKKDNVSKKIIKELVPYSILEEKYRIFKMEYYNRWGKGILNNFQKIFKVFF